MNDAYTKCKEVWDNVFAKESKIRVPEDPKTGNSDLDAGLDWLCTGLESVLDFGCGCGSLLFYCALRGTRRHLGIDISSAGINLANRRKVKMPAGEFAFRQGGIGALEEIAASSYDGAILSNIVDNLMPEDALQLLAQVERILRPGGKVLIKLNPYLEQEQIREWNIKVLEGNLLDDGLLLWNQTTDEWTQLLNRYFTLEEYKDIYYPQHEQYNRLFLLARE